MRFAYIDSQGNEVTIPSVDALALRIELGAIGPDTELYDAQADRWGPAHTHEIFHTLSRDAGGDTFLVPPSPRTEEPATNEPRDVESAGDEAPGDESRPPEVPPPLDAASLGLTLNPPGSPTAPPGPGPAATSGDATPAEPPEGPGPSPAAPAQVPPTPDESSFDLVDDLPLAFDGGFSEGEGELEPPVDFLSPDDSSEPDVLELESTMEFVPPTNDDAPDALDLEPPMSAFDPSGPPAWMEQDGPEVDEAAMDFSRPVSDGDVGGGPPSAGAGTLAAGLDPIEPSVPRRREPPPRRPTRRRRGGGRWMFGATTLALLAAGGYYGWRAFGERLAPPPPRPPVVIPAIPTELEAPMRSLAERALPAMYADIEGRVLAAVPEEPSPDWLAGVYLGNASRFAEVEVFWNGIAAFAERLGALEVETFRAEYTALVDSAGFDGTEHALMVARADSGFLATRDERLGSYRLLGRLADASLALHGFLVQNESSIAYTPATAFSGNPVEEAVPATEELGDRMWDLVEDITNALDALGTLDRVTRERLSTVLFDRINAIGIR